MQRRYAAEHIGVAVTPPGYHLGAVHLQPSPWRCNLLIRPLAPLLAAAVLAACSDSGSTDPDIADPDQLDLVIVSGDGQVAPVADPLAGSAAFSPAQTTPDNLLPEPLVARITVDGAEPSAAVAAGGPSFALLPANTSVTFRVVDHPEATAERHCGASFVDGAIPDDSGYVTTFWERGTLAATCTMEVRLVVDGEPRVDTVFTATFQPGPAVDVIFGGPGIPRDVQVGDTIHLTDMVEGGRDQYGNITDQASTVASIVASAYWTPADDTGIACKEGYPPTSPSEGWNVIVPAEVAAWPTGRDSYNACLNMSFAGRLRARTPMHVH
ncbi:MAG TPA: hypothetical protein VF212_05385 [Longimicrobiales bacterium]